ncbi:MAG: hypothetical protein K6B41_12175 [Butyrivibrio sp.]|nr:hypothetical protein [Butyrivibrio sp.]
MPDPNSELTLTYSSVLRDKNNLRIVRVRFERMVSGKLQFAEGVVPDGIIDKSNGFSPEEVVSLEEYLKGSADEIMKKAKVISNPLKWF